MLSLLVSTCSAGLPLVQTHSFDFTEPEDVESSDWQQQEEIPWEEGNLLDPGFESSGFLEEAVRAVTEGCCDKIRISIDLENDSIQEDRQGVYKLTTFNHNNHAEYHQEGGHNIVYFYRNIGWYVGGDYDTSGIQSTSGTTCPVEQTMWRYWTGEGWEDLVDGKVTRFLDRHFFKCLHSFYSCRSPAMMPLLEKTWFPLKTLL